MYSQFKFVQKDNSFTWESDFLSLNFYDPSIQGFKDFIQLSSAEEILYYYYTVRIFKKKLSWDDDDVEITKTSLVSERRTHDFPSITQLKWILETLLVDDATKDGQKILYTDGSVRFSKSLSTDGFACDDFYELTKSTNELNEEEQFVFYCGTTYDSQGDLNSIGIRTPYLSREDVESLLECVNGFIAYSIEQHNKWNRLSKDSYVVENNRLYSYGFSEDGVDKNIVEKILTVGDVLEIRSVTNNEETSFSKLTIEKIENNTVFFSNGLSLHSDSIAYVYKQVSEEELRYQEKEIIDDLYSILTDAEISDFKNLSMDQLLNKYKRAIINRTSMCRSEHGFNIQSDNGEPVEAVTPIVNYVIAAIKEKTKNK